MASEDGYLLFVWTPAGWLLEERNGELPAVGSDVEAGERQLRVSKHAPSPMPGDKRRCAYTQAV